MTKDTGHTRVSPIFTLKKDVDSRVATGRGITPRSHEQQMKSARIIMDRYDGALRKLAKL